MFFLSHSIISSLLPMFETMSIQSSLASLTIRVKKEFFWRSFNIYFFLILCFVLNIYIWYVMLLGERWSMSEKYHFKNIDYTVQSYNEDNNKQTREFRMISIDWVRQIIDIECIESGTWNETCKILSTTSNHLKMFRISFFLRISWFHIDLKQFIYRMLSSVIRYTYKFQIESSNSDWIQKKEEKLKSICNLTINVVNLEPVMYWLSWRMIGNAHKIVQIDTNRINRHMYIIYFFFNFQLPWTFYGQFHCIVN